MFRNLTVTVDENQGTCTILVEPYTRIDIYCTLKSNYLNNINLTSASKSTSLQFVQTPSAVGSFDLNGGCLSSVS